MFLNNGISGFYDSSNKDQIPNVQFEKFRKEIAGVLSAEGYSLLSSSKSGSTPNFHLVMFEKASKRIGVVCNAIYPLIALVSEPKENECKLNFCESPGITNAIRKYTEYTVLEMVELGSSVSSEQTSQLNGAEREQIKYWKPDTLGDIVFNWWD